MKISIFGMKVPQTQGGTTIMHNTRGGCFPPLAQKSKTEQAITLKLGDFFQICISKILNFIN